ncbi:MAG TPA: ABC transporter permease, partial [Trueperaceae bacterium]|nr:ABC transporter permease [Trueperaceae bacterium]
MSTLGRLALRNLLRHPWRSAATALGIGLGIAAVLTTLSVGANVEANLRSALQAAAGKADLLLTPGAGGRAV